MNAGPQPVDWFIRPAPGRVGLLNFSYNALDRHVIRGRADGPALLHPHAPAGTRSSYSFSVLLEQVGLLAGGLRELGVLPGASVLLALPREPGLVVALLACARIGAVAVASVAGLPDRPAVVLVDGARKLALHAALTETDKRPAYTVVASPEPGTLDQTGDLDLALLMRPGQFEPGVCAELPPDAPFLVLPDEAGVRTQGWCLDLTAGDDTPYADLLAPLLAGATVELC